ncbi:MAG: carboxymuconolactone decarboxylase family protein [Alistipes senegalensis]|nr:carboxymuconolactone decarboxylase family protein [Bacteroides cellulosilyticus]MCM1352263.1 carboxymuconolactone decarboxylase family protein [Alistipes senegalensis]
MKHTKIIGRTTLWIMGAVTALSVSAQSPSGLDAKEQSAAAIAAFTARGDMARLDAECEAGLDAGLTVNEIKEVLVQMYAYCGFPRSLNALNVFMATVERRKAAGKQDAIGREASPISEGTNMSEEGERVRTVLVGRPVTGKVYEFCPVIDEYLRSHLFGDIFARDNLSHAYRELATVGALAGMNLAGQLRSHLSICRNIGFTEEQLRDFGSLVARKIGDEEGRTVDRVLDEIYK